MITGLSFLKIKKKIICISNQAVFTNKINSKILSLSCVTLLLACLPSWLLFYTYRLLNCAQTLF